MTLTITVISSAQNEIGFREKNFDFHKVKVFDPLNIEPNFNPVVTSLEAPVPGGNSYRSALLQLKKRSSILFPPSNDKSSNETSDTLEYPTYVDGFPMRKYIKALDTIVLVSGGIPLDNTLAISNDNFLVCGINSQIFIQNLNLGVEPDENNVKVISFADFANGVSTYNPFDPKIIYDPESNRFIVVFLTGRNPQNSGIIVAFSQSSNPMDSWNVYKLDGNPLNDDSWTDFPAISISKEELYITVNLLIPDVNWKVGFKTSLIWQIDKADGYAGNTILNSKLWSDISLDGRNLRNLTPIQGGDSLQGPNMYFLSNRNFDLQNDTFFLVEVTGTQFDPSSTLTVQPVISDESYGLPPNGTQANSTPGSPDEGFDTNDSRVLGGIKIDNTIHFVGNTKDFSNGRAGIYHGIISNVNSNPSLKGSIISDELLDFGYPNVAFSGTESCRNSVFIAFNHTSVTDFAGTSVVRYKDGAYSERLPLKNGSNYVERITGPYERWGDYYGIQRKYNEPGVIWTAGFYGLESKNSATWISKLEDVEDCFCKMPYCSCVDPMILDLVRKPLTDSGVCFQNLELNVRNGEPPFKYYLNNQIDDSLMEINSCQNNEIKIVDSKGCELNQLLKGEIINPKPPIASPTLYPNPNIDGTFSIYFELATSSNIHVKIFSVDGNLVKEFSAKEQASPGRNVLTFSTEPLRAGTYVVIMEASGTEIYRDKMVIQ